jgi:tetratricopeptide (TPR) repeat protein
MSANTKGITIGDHGSRFYPHWLLFLPIAFHELRTIPEVAISVGGSVSMLRSHLKGVTKLRRPLSIEVMKICRFLFATLAIGFGFVPCANSQNVDLAKDLAEEGVTNEAKIEFLKVLHDPAKKASYDVAQYHLGYLSFKEQNYERALKHWNDLSKNYPSSPYTERARQQIQIAYQLLSKQQAKESENI